MSQISEVVLFYSKFSKECKECVDVIQNYKVPVGLIPLDTVVDREAAMNGSVIQIKNVPSLVVTYTDGKTQLYVGSDKILKWLSIILKSGNNNNESNNNGGNNNGGNSHTSLSEDESSEERPKKKKKKSVKKKSYKPKKDGNHVELIMGENNNNSSPYKNTGIPDKLSTTKMTPKSPNESVLKLADEMRRQRDSVVKNSDK
jgi:hypothetical protein